MFVAGIANILVLRLLFALEPSRCPLILITHFLCKYRVLMCQILLDFFFEASFLRNESRVLVDTNTLLRFEL